MEKLFKIIVSILLLLFATICFAAICKSLDRTVDILSWIGGCAFYMLGQLLAKWIYE